MKFRSRIYKSVEEQNIYWPSFVDIMTTAALVFFFIMICALGISKMHDDDIIKQRNQLYSNIQKELNKRKVDKNVIRFDKNEGKIIISTESYFDTGKWKLNSDGKYVANLIGRIFLQLFNNGNISKKIDYVEVVGHTDFKGNTLDNRILSTNRAVSFVNEMVPMNSVLENEFGGKFKASGMSEFETNKTPKERNMPDSKYSKEKTKSQRKIEIRLIFNNKDIEDQIKKSNIN